MQGDADGALEHLSETMQLSQDPRTIAWAHIYLGRMYDMHAIEETRPPERDKAIAEYKAALANRDSQPDTKAAAEKGIKAPFELPKRPAMSADHLDTTPGSRTTLDPTGKARKGSLSANPAAVNRALGHPCRIAESGKLKVGISPGADFLTTRP